MDIATTLMLLRRKSGMSQQELANRLGKSLKTIYRWERGEGAPDMTEIPELAKSLGISINQLFGETDDPNPGGATPMIAQTVRGDGNTVAWRDVNTGRVNTSPIPTPQSYAPWWTDALTRAYDTARNGTPQDKADAVATVKTALDVLERAVATA